MAGILYLVVMLAINTTFNFIVEQLAIQNLKAFLKEATRGNNDCPLIPGVNFINGDIFDAISTVSFGNLSSRMSPYD